jgi:hypothetical protein
MPNKKEKPSKTITKDGLFISRAMRRNAEAAAEQEAAAQKIAAEDAEDQKDAERYRAKYPVGTPDEEAVNAQRAQAQATADARKKFKVKEPAAQ